MTGFALGVTTGIGSSFLGAGGDVGTISSQTSLNKAILSSSLIIIEYNYEVTNCCNYRTDFIRCIIRNILVVSITSIGII
jgi:hypothetical protein